MIELHKIPKDRLCRAFRSLTWLVGVPRGWFKKDGLEAPHCFPHAPGPCMHVYVCNVLSKNQANVRKMFPLAASANYSKLRTQLWTFWFIALVRSVLTKLANWRGSLMGLSPWWDLKAMSSSWYQHPLDIENTQLLFGAEKCGLHIFCQKEIFANILGIRNHRDLFLIMLS